MPRTRGQRHEKSLRGANGHRHYDTRTGRRMLAADHYNWDIRYWLQIVCRAKLLPIPERKRSTGQLAPAIFIAASLITQGFACTRSVHFYQHHRLHPGSAHV